MCSGRESNCCFWSCSFYPLKIPGRGVFWSPFFKQEIKMDRAEMILMLEYKNPQQIFPPCISSADILLCQCFCYCFGFVFSSMLLPHAAVTCGTDGEVISASPTPISGWAQGSCCWLPCAWVSYIRFLLMAVGGSDRDSQSCAVWRGWIEALTLLVAPLTGAVGSHLELKWQVETVSSPESLCLCPSASHRSTCTHSSVTLTGD